jgi:hypothetical protein
MISKSKRIAVAQLIDQGLSDRQISRMKKLSRTGVALIRKRKQARAARRVAPLPTVPSGQRRCPNCGGIVELPCRLCRIRKTTSHGVNQEVTLRQLARNTLLAALMQPPLRRAKDKHRRAS